MNEKSETVQSEGMFFRKFHPSSDPECCRADCREWVAVLLHGWLGSNCDMSGIANELAKAGLSVYVPDLPYHGESLLISPETLASASLTVFQAFSHIVPRKSRIVLFGYSMGGRLALELVRRWISFPNNEHILEGAVFVSSALPYRNPDLLQSAVQREKRTSRTVLSLKNTKCLEKWLREDWYTKEMWGNLKTSPAFDILIQRRLHMYSASVGEGWSNAAVRLGTSKMEEYIEGALIPVLYIHGELDTKYKGLASSYKKLFPSFSHCEILDCGHNVLAESESEVIAATLSFLLKSCGARHIRLQLFSWKYLPYELQLLKGMTVGCHKITHRQGFLVALILTCGSSGVGDVAPLPGWHALSLEDAERDIAKSLIQLQKTSFCVLCFSFAPKVSHSAVVASAVEAALIQALAKSIGFKLEAFIRELRNRNFYRNRSMPVGTEPRRQGAKLDNKVLINGVLPRSLSCASETQVSEFVSSSMFRVLKLKVGAADNILDDIKVVRSAVAAAIHCEKSIRLDANQAWSADQWRQFRDGIGNCWKTIEFIEEPLYSSDILMQALERGHIRSDVGIALDESLTRGTSTSLRHAMRSKACKAIVVKPSMYPSLADLFQLSGDAAEMDTKVIISSTFESGVGLAWQSHLARCLGTKGSSHGLGTFAHLKHDVVHPHFKEYCIDSTGFCVDLRKCEAFLDLCTQTVIRLGSSHMKKKIDQGNVMLHKLSETLKSESTLE